MSTAIAYKPQLIVDVEDVALLGKLRNAIKMMQGVGKIMVARKQHRIKAVASTPMSNLYEVSPRLKALEGDYVCPKDLSFDYKHEVAHQKVDKYL